MKRRPESLTTALSRYSRWYDAGPLVAVPLVLVGVFLLPYQVRVRFALAYAHPSVSSLYLANFTHLTLEHLASNLLGYVLVVPTVYVLCVLGDRRRRFWGVFTVFLTVFPVALSTLNVALSGNTTRIALGFSGVLAAFVGFLPIALLWYTRRRFTGDVALQHAPLFYFTGVGVLATVALPVGSMTLVVLAFAGLGLLLSGHRLLADLRDLSVSGFRDAFSPPGYLELGAVAVVLFVGFPFAAFPSVSLQHGAYTNLYLHLVGYSLGYLVPYATFALANPRTSAVTTHTT